MKWIKYSEQIPPKEGEYLVCLRGNLILLAKWYGLDNPDRPWENRGWKLPYDFTHWMELPEPPEEE